MEKKFASVLLDVAIDKPLDYEIPSFLLPSVYPGARVQVPLRNKTVSGYILAIKDRPDFSPTQSISQIENSPITAKLFELAFWMSEYYCSSLRDTLRTIVPATLRKKVQPKQQLYVMRAKTKEQLKDYCVQIRTKFPAQADVLDILLKIKKKILLTELLEKTQGTRSPILTLAKKGFLTLDTLQIDRSPLVSEEYFPTLPKVLNDEQSIALKNISQSIHQENFHTHLLYGITGSGKTEVYLQAIGIAKELGKSTIMLVPEISLTAQTIERFRSRFEGSIAILHHRLSDGERWDEWMRIQEGKAQIVIGARSAIFSPVKNLGLIIVDEEHEGSYKQSEHFPCYHARDVAVMRGKIENCTVVLGSATPSLESFYNCQLGKYQLNLLSTRADHAQLPKVTLIDMKKEFEKKKGHTTFSDKLLDEILIRKKKGEQTILFLNRRGYHTTLLCQACGVQLKCNHCDVSLTFHNSENALCCHLCGFQVTPTPIECPSCQNREALKFKGIGTELVEKALHAIFPDIRTIRLDADTTRHKGSHNRLLKEFITHKADVLIGTQMIAKGLHFPQVTLVGILNSDASLQIPDFRASEVAFQLITQVSGRAGRGCLPGEVLIQTCMPDNQMIQFASTQNYELFYTAEIASRKFFSYPPFCQMAKILFSGTNPQETFQAAEIFRQEAIFQLSKEYRIQPVAASSYAKIKDKFRFQFLIFGPHGRLIAKTLSSILQTRSFSKQIRVLIDINPLSTF